jgi:glucokinase
MSVNRRVAVGIEVGGSKATIALIDQYGRVQQRRHAKTLRGRPAAATLEPYLRAVDELLASAKASNLAVCGIGVSIPGSLDHTMRRPCVVPLLPSLNGFPLCDLLETRFTLPAHLDVDVDAALLGEYNYGAGRGFQRLLYLTMNAVVGASLVIDGRLERSDQQYTGHISHLPVASNGPRCSCGKRGCINTLISMDALQRMVQRALRRGEESTLTQRLLNREYFSPQLLAEEAVRGDSVALQIYNEIGRWLSAAISKYIDLFGPHILILGGKVLNADGRANHLLLSRVRTALNTQPASRVCSIVEVVPSVLGNDAALMGVVQPIFHPPVTPQAEVG